MIPLYKPYMPEVPLVDEILHSGQLAYGKYGKEFERLLREFFTVENLIVTNSYNLAILVSLSALGIQPGDTVIASPMACLTSTQPLLSAGINIRWGDVDPATGTLSPDSVLNLMPIKPKAIIHNHFCGFVGYVDEINEIGREYGVPVIDDCIEAFGSEYKGRKLGNTGTDITVFSFNAVRVPNTLDGGAIVFKRKELFEKSLLIRDAGIDRSCFRDSLGEINPDCDISLIGHSATMDEVKGYIGSRQMTKVDWILKRQRQNALAWDQILMNDDNLIPIKSKTCQPNYWVYGTLAKNKSEAIVRYRNKGFYASGVHINNNIYSVFKDKSRLPGVNEFNGRFVALPCGWWADIENADRI